MLSNVTTPFFFYNLAELFLKIICLFQIYFADYKLRLIMEEQQGKDSYSPENDQYDK